MGLSEHDDHKDTKHNIYMIKTWSYIQMQNYTYLKIWLTHDNTADSPNLYGKPLMHRKNNNIHTKTTFEYILPFFCKD